MFDVKVKASDIFHDSVESVVFICQPFCLVGIVGYYYGILFHPNLTTQKWIWKLYGDGIMSVTEDKLLHEF